MSCNHDKAISAFQKAKDIGALHKLLTKILAKSPKAVEEAWDDVGLGGHPCPICKKAGLVLHNANTYTCPSCSSITRKGPVV